MAGRKSHKKIIVIIIVVVLLGGGAAAYYFYVRPLLMGNNAIPTNSGNTESVHKQKVEQDQTKVDSLVTVGDEASIEQAKQIADTQIDAAEKSGDDAYIVDASIQKAGILIQTGQSQEALDTILFPLQKKYEGNATYKRDIYMTISWAYRVMGDETTADSYFNQGL